MFDKKTFLRQISAGIWGTLLKSVKDYFASLISCIKGICCWLHSGRLFFQTLVSAGCITPGETGQERQTNMETHRLGRFPVGWLSCRASASLWSNKKNPQRLIRWRKARGASSSSCCRCDNKQPSPVKSVSARSRCSVLTWNSVCADSSLSPPLHHQFISQQEGKWCVDDVTHRSKKAVSFRRYFSSQTSFKCV